MVPKVFDFPRIHNIMKLCVFIICIYFSRIFHSVTIFIKCKVHVIHLNLIMVINYR